jgi:hypothetical protein
MLARHYIYIRAVLAGALLWCGMGSALGQLDTSTSSPWHALIQATTPEKTCFVTTPAWPTGATGGGRIALTTQASQRGLFFEFRSDSALKEQADVVVSVDSKSIATLPARGNRAIASSAALNEELALTMLKGKTISAFSFSTDGHIVRNTFSLSGFSAALRAIEPHCPGLLSDKVAKALTAVASPTPAVQKPSPQVSQPATPSPARQDASNVEVQCPRITPIRLETKARRGMAVLTFRAYNPNNFPIRADVEFEWEYRAVYLRGMMGSYTQDIKARPSLMVELEPGPSRHVEEVPLPQMADEDDSSPSSHGRVRSVTMCGRKTW